MGTEGREAADPDAPGGGDRPAQREFKAREWQACLDDLDAAEKMDPIGAGRYRGLRATAESQLKVHEVPRNYWYGPAKP